MLLFSQIGKSNESVVSSLDNIKKGSNNVIDWRCLIQAYIFDKDIKNAYEYFIKAIQKFPNDSIIYTLGGDICGKLNRYDEALSYWDKAVELDNTCLDAKYSKLNYYAQIGEKYSQLDAWSMYLITGYEEAQKYIGKKADKNRKIYNGMLKTYLYQYMGPKPPKKH